MLVEGIRISASGVPAVPQQGAIRFHFDLPKLRAHGALNGVGFTATSTEPSVMDVDVAPYVVKGPPAVHSWETSDVTWQIRSTSGKIGHVDVDVELDFLTWVGIIGAALTFEPFFLPLVIVDPIAGAFGTDAANEELAARNGLPLGGLPDLLAGLLAAHALRKGFGTGSDLSQLGFEAVYLDGWLLSFFVRNDRGADDGPLQTSFTSLPEKSRDFGTVTAGSVSAVGHVLLVNSGNLPVSLDDVQVLGSTEFAITSPVTWPRIITPGIAEQLDLRFSPQGSPGFRSATLRAAYNQGHRLELTLAGIAEAAPIPSISVIPRQLNFGVVNVNTTATLELTIRNDGGAPLAIAAMHIDGPDAALFGLPGEPPGAIQSGQTTAVAVTFTPVAMVAGGQRATLMIESNDNNQPQLAVGLFGAGIASSLLVMPTNIVFNDSPLAGALPPGVGSRSGVNILNVGAAALTVTGPSFQVLDQATGQQAQDYQVLDRNGQIVRQDDVRIEGGALVALSVQFRPITAGDHPARMEIQSTDPAQLPTIVSITGRGVA